MIAFGLYDPLSGDTKQFFDKKTLFMMKISPKSRFFVKKTFFVMKILPKIQIFVKNCPRIKRDYLKDVIQALGFILPKFQPERSYGDLF